MTAHDRSRLYLFARLPIDVRRYLGRSNDIDIARHGRSLVSEGRLHITIADLDAIGAPRAYVISLIGWILSTIPPFAFRVAFDELVVSPRIALLKASAPLAGVAACQAHIAAMLADHGIALPKAAMPVPHVTLGYGYRDLAGIRLIDSVSWRVDELALVRSLCGQTTHQHLASWRLPLPMDAAALRQAG